MKILVLNYEFPPLGGGAAPVSKDIAIKLCERRNDVTVITMGYKDLPSYEEIRESEYIVSRVTEKRKMSAGPWEQFFYLITARRLIRKLMTEQDYDVCHAHFIVPTGELARWTKKKYHIPYIITAHGSDVEGHNQKVSMRIMHRFLRSAWRRIVQDSSSVISPSRYLLDLMEHNYPCGRYLCIPNGIEWEEWHRLAAGGKEKRILIMGRLQKFKNVQMILQALGQVELGDWQVDILGDGPYRMELEKITEKLALSERVHFYGWIDNKTEEQLNFVKKASVYITASKFENCPMSVIEAAAAGCSLLLSDIPAHRQLIDEEQCFFELGNTESLSGKIQKIIRNGVIDFQKGIDVSSYDWETITLRYEYMLKNAIVNNT